jgi:HPt (histidine-containing phosphotransfer) domain-containing protein
METVWIAIKDGKVYGVTSDKETMLEMINSYIDDNTSILETNTTILAGNIRAEEWVITE